MKTNHTPGPWEWMDNSLWGSETSATHNGKTCAEMGHSSAECGPSVLGIECGLLCGDGNDWNPSQPDRFLIAAAPDLLAALQGIIRVADRSTIEFDAARAAIALALGAV